MFTPNPDRPYFDAWLRRTGRQLSVSGRMSQIAVVLATRNGGSPDEWKERLRTVLEGKEVPSLDLLIQIESLLAPPKDVPPASDMTQGSLF